jgi:hypothetical protein
VSTSHFHTGTHSLAVSIGIAAFSTNDSRGASVTVPLCVSNGTINLAGYTMSAWMLLSISQGTLPMNAANLSQGFLRGPDNSGTGDTDSFLAVGQSTLNVWQNLQGNIIQSSSSNAAVGINIEFPIANPSSEGFAGTLYIDDVQLIPP